MKNAVAVHYLTIIFLNKLACIVNDSLTLYNKVSADDLGSKIRATWTQRNQTLDSDFAFTAWTLDIKSEVRKDMRKRMRGHGREAVERVIQKLYAGGKDDIDIIINNF